MHDEASGSLTEAGSMADDSYDDSVHQYGYLATVSSTGESIFERHASIRVAIGVRVQV
jgi:hypothetical protein